MPLGAYTIDGLAKFLGEVDDTGHATHGFKDTFGALELIDGKGLTDSECTRILCANCERQMKSFPP